MTKGNIVFVSIVILLVITFFSTMTYYSTKPKITTYSISFTNKTYCDGWEKGYIEGYCYEIVNCIEPVVPVCPIPKIGQEDYQDGYNRGFTTGKNDNDGNK